MPGSGISPRDGEIILRFLYYYTQVIRGHGQEEEVIEDALQSSPYPDSSQPEGSVEGADMTQGEAPNHVD